MREDMAKVIVERPRTGGGVKYPRGSARGRERVAVEDWGRREGMRRPWARRPARKNLNENLAPLRRFLQSKVGRSWNEVYSEICERIDRDSAVQLHIWQHLVEFVCTNPYEVDGDVGGRAGWQRASRAFFVDPRTGRLCVNEPYFRRRVFYPRPRGAEPHEIDERIPAGDGREYRRIDGVWYELALAPLARGADAAPDVVLRKRWDPAPAEELRRFYGRRVYATGKRQLNKREIRRLAREGQDGGR